MMRVTDVNTYRASISSASQTTINCFKHCRSFRTSSNLVQICRTLRLDRASNRNCQSLLGASAFMCPSFLVHFLLPVPGTFYSRRLSTADSDFNSSQPNSRTRVAQYECRRFCTDLDCFREDKTEGYVRHVYAIGRGNLELSSD